MNGLTLPPCVLVTEDDIEQRRPPMHRHWVYNDLDCAVTSEVAAHHLPVLAADPDLARYYRFSFAQQLAAYAMMHRGVAVDPVARAQALKEVERDELAAVKRLQEVAGARWKDTEQRTGKCADGKPHRWSDSIVEQKARAKITAAAEAAGTPADGPDNRPSYCVKCRVPRLVAKSLNPHSPLQISKLLYDYMSLAKQRNHKTGDVSVDDECLGRLKEREPGCGEIVEAILAARGARKQAGLLRAPLDADGRWRQSVNVGTAVTGRWSSSGSPFWTGGNIQNIAQRSRNIFCADPGTVMWYADYEKAESNIVAYDAEDDAYIRAHGAGDTHTYVCRLVWPEVRPWGNALAPTNCGRKHDGTHPEDCCDRGMAEHAAPWDANHPLRWYGKHVGHGVAIGMTEYGIARDARIKLAEARKARDAFAGAFPRVLARQDEIWRDVVDTGLIVSPLGRVRVCLGRIHGDAAAATRREALAQIQQSMIVDWVSIALMRVWGELDGGIERPRMDDLARAWVLAQIHDAILGEVRVGDDAALARIVELMGFGMTIRGRRLVIPVEIKIGRNWRDMHEWKPGFNWEKFA